MSVIAKDDTNMKKIVAIVQARMSSTRLPGKVLLDIMGKSLLAHIIDRISKSKLVNSNIVLATTTNPADHVIVDFANENQLDCFIGSEEDVLDRYYQAAKQADADIIVRITADDPFKDPEVMDEIIQIMIDGDFDYVSNTIKPTYPEGLDIEVFSFESLKKAWIYGKKPSEREHVTPYIWNNPDIFKLYNVEYGRDLSSMRWTLDTNDDFEFTKAIYEKLYVVGETFLMKDVLDLLTNEPELQEINAGIERSAGYKKSLRDELL